MQPRLKSINYNPSKCAKGLLAQRTQRECFFTLSWHTSAIVSDLYMMKVVVSKMQKQRVSNAFLICSANCLLALLN